MTNKKKAKKEVAKTRSKKAAKFAEAVPPPPGRWRVDYDRPDQMIYSGSTSRLYRICNNGEGWVRVATSDREMLLPSGQCMDVDSKFVRVEFNRQSHSTSGTYEFPKAAMIVMEPPGHWRSQGNWTAIYTSSIPQMYRICNDGPVEVRVWTKKGSETADETDVLPGSCFDAIGSRIFVKAFNAKAAGTYERMQMPKPLKRDRVRKASKNAKEGRRTKG